MPTYDKIPKPTTSYTDLSKPTTLVFPFWSFIDASWSEIEALWSAYLMDSFTKIEKPSTLYGGLPFFSGGLQPFLVTAPFALLGSYKPETEYNEVSRPPLVVYPFWSFIDANWEDVADNWSDYQVPSWTEIAKPL